MDIPAKRITIWIITASAIIFNNLADQPKALAFGWSCSRARQDGHKFTKSSICPIHNVQMKEVPIIYGYPGDIVIEKAERDELILGGCIIKEDNPETGYICPVDGKVFYRKP